MFHFHIENATGGNRVESKRRGREGGREREQRISGVIDRALDRIENGMGQKWPLEKWTPEYFYQCKSIEQINFQSNWVDLKFFNFIGATTFVLMMTCFDA